MESTSKNTIKCKILNTRDSAIFLDNKFYDCNVDLELDFSEAIRISKRCPIDLRIGSVPKYNENHWKEDKYFGFTSHLDSTSGWGKVTYYLLKNSIDKKPALVGMVSGIIDRDISRMSKEKIRQDGIMIWHEQPNEKWVCSPFSKNIGLVPFETSLIPARWVGIMNRLDAVITYSNHCKKAFLDSGIRVPIEVFHLGIDFKKFYPLKRDNKVFTFGHMGALSLRKGTDLLVKAFSEAFPNGEKVKLICKTSNTFYHFMTKDKRIEVHLSPWTHEELIDNFWKKIDCFVFPTRGEGAGLPPVEACATGIPCIVTNGTGQSDYFNEKMGWGLDFKWVPAEDFSKNVYKEDGDCGNWMEPDYKQLVKYLRYCYENQEEVKKKGISAQKYVQENYTWEKGIKEFWKNLNKHLIK
jgi:glycosyltransferase involved in cell wall biosynthesis